jgi:F-type H+-transporting ATPase subunit b
MGAEEYVLFGFILFVLLLLYLGVHTKIAGALDARIDKVKTELAEAEKLRAEAAAVLDDYKRKAKQAETDAVAIVEQAKAEAVAIAQENEQRIAEFVARRTKQAEQKIALAETQATADVKAAAAEAATRAAEHILRQNVQGKSAGDMLAKSIEEMKSRLN